MKTMNSTFIHRPDRIMSLAVARASRQITVEESWLRFVAAKQRSEHTLSVEDGIAAGKAYADFLDLFVGRSA